MLLLQAEWIQGAFGLIDSLSMLHTQRGVMHMRGPSKHLPSWNRTPNLEEDDWPTIDMKDAIGWQYCRNKSGS
jgi:hypothetical protein